MRNIVVFSGTSHPKFVENICQYLSVSPGEVDHAKFKNGETSIAIKESVRNKDVYVVQSSIGHVNDMLMELLIMISACKSASAKRVTAVLTLFPYSRQPDVHYQKNNNSSSSSSSTMGYSTPKLNRFDSFQTARPSLNFLQNETNYRPWMVQSGTLIADLLTTAGADHIITMDLHDAQFQGFFDIPVDNLYSKSLIIKYITSKYPSLKDTTNNNDCVIVSPDSGGAKRAIAIADVLELDFALIHKEKRKFFQYSPVCKNGVATHQRQNSSVSNLDFPSQQQKSLAPSASSSILSSTVDPTSAKSTTMLVGDVKDKNCIIIDDIIDTSSTIIRAAKILKDQGAKYVLAIITHGVFSGDAIERLKRSMVDGIVVSNSLPQQENLKKFPQGFMDVFDVSGLFGESIRRIHNGESVSQLFDTGI